MNQPTTADGFRAILGFMGAARRRQLAGTLALMLLGGVAEIVSVASVLPFLALLASPDEATQPAAVAATFRLFGIEPSPAAIGPAVTILISAVLLAAAVRMILTWVTYRFILALGHDIGSEIYARMLRQPYPDFVRRNSSELVAGIEKVQIVIFGILLPIMQGAVAGFIALIIIGFLVAIDPASALLAAATMTIAYLGVSLSVRRILNRNAELLAGAQTERIKLVQEALGGMRDVLIDQSQPVFDRAFRAVDRAFRHAQAANAFLAAAPRFIVESIGIVFIAVLALVLSRGAGGLAAALPVVGALALGAQRLLPLLQMVYNGWSQYAAAASVLTDVVHLLNAPVLQGASTSTPLSFEKTIRLEGLRFRYFGQSRDALADIDLTIPKGEKIGIVGKTGSGKSTLIDIILGLLPPTEGTFSIDGTPLTAKSGAGWQRNIAHVPQAIYLTDSSIAANIAFGVEAGEIDIGRVREAARRAQIDEFILSLEDGYETMVGERGVRLSGGQRQRIGIARALYKGAKVLVLDEATSALDDETEAAVIKSLFESGPELTVLMIAHRLTTLSQCDRVIRLDHGKIAATGDYETMIGAVAKRASGRNG